MIMKHKQTEDGNFLIKLEPGDRVINAINSIMEYLNIKAGLITGIGAVNNPTLGYFDINQKKYIEKTLTGNFEVLSLNGNIAQKEEKPFCHIHVILGDNEMKTFGGHLIEMEVTVTLELIVIPLKENLRRTPDETTSLWLWNL